MKKEAIKVLLIDDDEDDYVLTRALLADVDAGRYSLDWASSYEEGLIVAQRREHHVCLVDYHLGEHSGVELIRAAREARLTTPMILLTGSGDYRVDVEAMEAGATDYLVKAETSPARMERTIRYAVQLNIERCKAEEDLAAYAQKQAVVAEIGRWALTGGELKDLCAKAVTLVARTLDVEFCKVLELQPGGQALILRAGVGWKEEYPVGVATISTGKGSQAGFTLFSEEPLVVEDLRTDQRFEGLPLLHDHGVVSGMSVVIGPVERPYGVMGAHTGSLRKFAASDVDFLVAVANVLAEAIDRKRAEDELRKSEARFRRVVESNLLGIFFIDAEGIITEANDAFLKIVGYSREDLLSGRLSSLKITPPEYEPNDQKAFSDLAATGVCEAYEKEFLRKNGQRISILIGCARLDEGQQAGVCFVIDISDRKRAQAALRESDRWHRELVENAHEIIYTHDLAGRFTSLNKAGEETFGYTFGNGMINVLELIAPEYRVAARQQMIDHVSGGEQSFYETEAVEIVTKDDRRIALEGSSRLIYQNGVPVGVQGITRDVTERRQAQEALARSESQFRALFENANDAVMVANDQGEYVDANPAACALLGVTYDQIVGHRVGTFTPLEDRAAALSQWEQFLKVGRMRGLLHLIRPDGKKLEVDFTATANFLPGRHLGAMRDVTEHRKVEEQLRQSQKLESVGMLAGGIAHDFNNLLTVITGYSELTLRRLDHQDPLARNVEEIKRASERATILTRQLLAFSRKQVLQPKILDLNTVLANIQQMLGRLVGEHLELMLLPDLKLGLVRADPGQVEQIILNLVVNARDAMPRGGKITLETANIHLDEAYARLHLAAPPGWYAMLAVSDAGHGMDAETQRHIFEPFFTTKDQGKGTGLGLSTVYGIVKQSGGDIWVYSEIGVGTTFKIYFPLVDEQIEAADPAPARPGAEAGTETILLAEDEEMVRNLARDSLLMHGYNVLEAANAGEALLIGQQHAGPIHLLLTDVVMPRLSGRELAERLVKLRPDMRVLFMSGYADQSIVHHGILDSDIAFLGKPFTPDALVHKVVDVLLGDPRVSV